METGGRDAMTIEFGKFKGKDIREVPLDYLTWLADSNRNNLAQVENEIERRELGAEREKLEKERRRFDDARAACMQSEG